MPSKIDLDANTPYFDFQTPLENKTYTIQCRWNSRIERWFMDVLNDAGDTVLLGGLCLIANWPLALYITGREPPGWLIVVDTSGGGTDPDLNSLGKQHQLWYYTKAEIDAR